VQFTRTIVSGLETHNIKIIHVISGSDTVHVQRDVTGIDSVGLPELYLNVCYHNGLITAYLRGFAGTGASQPLAYNAGSLIGGEFGLGTGTLVNVIWLVFWEYKLDIDTDDGSCAPCTVISCCRGASPATMTVVITASGVATITGTTTFDCGQLAGTHVLNRGTPGGGPNDDGTCSWYIEFDTFREVSGVPQIGTLTRIILDIAPTARVRCLWPTSPHGSNYALLTFTKSIGVDIPCSEWEDVAGFTATALCNSGATCEVSA
jgi:hypothetical protein